MDDRIGLIKKDGDGNMKKKIKILCYECEKCDKRVYFRSDEEYTTQCKTCKNEMKFQYENNYDPKAGLRAIKDSNVKNSINIVSNPIVECPYCHSNNTKKIHYFSWLGMVGKQFHCNNCNANF